MILRVAYVYTNTTSCDIVVDHHWRFENPYLTKHYEEGSGILRTNLRLDG
jgi:hypothetical protein